MSRLPERLLLAGILLVAGLLYVGSAGFFDLITTSYGSDVGHYVITAQSLAQGDGYRYVNDPHRPLTARLPPLLPMLLSPLVAAFPHNVHVLRLFAAVLCLGAVVCCYVYLRRVAPAWALGITALFALNVHVVSTAAIPQSDLTFTMLLYAILGLCTACGTRTTLGDAALAPLIVLIVLAVYTRIVALALVPAVTLWLWWIGRRRAAVVVLALVLLGVAPWFAYSYRLTGSLFAPGYAADFFGRTRPMAGADGLLMLLRTAAGNSSWLATEALPDAVSGFYMGQAQRLAQTLGVEWMLCAVGLSITVVMAGGFWLRARRHGGVAELLLALYGAVVLVDSVHEARYLLPLLPLLYVHLFTGVTWIARRVSAPSLTRLAGAVILLVMVVRVASFYEKGLSWLDERVGRESWIAWLAARSEPGVVYSASPRLLSFYTGRHSLDYPAWLCASDSDPTKLRSNGQTYVALHPLFGAYSREYRCMSEAIRRRPGRFVEEFRDDSLSVVIYRVQQD